MIDYDTFLAWAQDRFGDIVVKGNEIKTHSIFCEDYKYHLWMNPSGGKKERPLGAYRCWKTDKMGSLVALVALVDKIPYEEAVELISDTIPLRVLEQKVDDFFSNLSGEIPKDIEIPETEELQLPFSTYLINELDKYNYFGKKAFDYLENRKIPTEGLYVCTNGEYKDRLIIPYYNRDDELIYYNGRALGKSNLRYLKAKTKTSQSEVLFCRSWPKSGTKIYLTEGEFDAISLDVMGVCGVACGGKFISDIQIEMIRDYRVVLAFDGDDPGKQSLINIGNALLNKGFNELLFVRPPLGFKDWNEVLKTNLPERIHGYIIKAEKPYNKWSEDLIGFSEV